MIFNLLSPLADEFILFNLIRYTTFRAGAACMTALFVALALLYSRHYLERRGMLRGEYYVLALTALLDIFVIVSAGSPVAFAMARAIDGDADAPRFGPAAAISRLMYPRHLFSSMS